MQLSRKGEDFFKIVIQLFRQNDALMGKRSACQERELLADFLVTNSHVFGCHYENGQVLAQLVLVVSTNYEGYYADNYERYA
jgi:hypothetical protein